jgi:hypothetical protein
VPKFGKIVKFLKGPCVNGAKGTRHKPVSRTPFSAFTVNKVR